MQEDTFPAGDDDHMHFEKEEDLANRICSTKYGSDMFPHVWRIAEKNLEPDTDIVEFMRWNPNGPFVRGYEVKLMSPTRDRKRLANRHFCEGLGQALLLPRIGVEQAILVLGFDEKVSKANDVK